MSQGTSVRVRVLMAFASLALCSASAAAQSTTFARDDYAAAAAPRAIAVADFNRDGWLDVATAGTGTDAVRVLLNNGAAGGFRALPDRIVGGGPFDLAAGDFNRDGNPDVIVANADANAVQILFGAGDGTFPIVTLVPVNSGNPRGVTLADFNGDGALDIIVTQYARHVWTVMYGDGNGGIFLQSEFGAIANPQGVVAADFNRDGRVDVAIAGAGINLVTVWYTQPNGGITPKNISVGAAVNVLTYGDYNKDGWLDLSAASTSNNTIYTLRGGATGLAWTATNGTGASPRGIVAADVNADGRLDLVTGNRAASTVCVHLGNGSGTFAAPLTFAAGAGSRAVAAGDFDHDGAADIASANEFGNSTTVLSNSTNFVAPAFRFSAFAVVPTPSGVSGPDELAVADFDRDGRLDVASETSGGLFVWLAARGRVVVDSTAFANDIAVADFNGDGAPDVVTPDYFGKVVRTYLNRGDGTFAAGRELASTLPVFGIATGDFNRDGRADIVYQAADEAQNTGILRVALGNGDGTFTAAGSASPLPNTAQQIVVADVDNDGRSDIVAAGPNPSGFLVWYGRGDGTAFKTQFFDMPPAVSDLVLADLNEDGRLDVIANGDSNVVQVRLASAAGGFGAVMQYAATLKHTNTFIHDVGAGDLNLDGHVDVITNEADILYGRGDGTLALDRLSTFEGGGQTATVADYNGDGLPDMLFVETGGFTSLLNERGGTNRPPTVSAGPDKTVTIRDFFDDTSIDATGADPDQHELQFQWRNAQGTVVSNEPSFFPSQMPAGQYTFTVTATDGRGGQASDSMVLTVASFDEIYFHALQFDSLHGAWRTQDDPTAADGVALRHPNAGAPKQTTPLANPVHYVEASFPAEPGRAYKLWLRLKADANDWPNDSVFVQFEGATDANGNPVFQIGSTSAMTVNLEECSGCGLSGWGWEDDAWGARNATSTTALRFPSGSGRIRIQTREDGVWLDQVVLSAVKYVSTRPGTAKNDTLIVPVTVPFE